VVLAAGQLLIPILITKLAGSDEDGASQVGAWTLASAITGPLFVFFLFKLRVLQTTDGKGEHAWSTYASVRLWSMIIATAVTAVIVLTRYRSAVGLVVLGAALAKAFEGGSDILYGVLQRHERLDRVSRSQVARGLASLLAAAVVLVATRSIALGSLTVAAVYAVGFAWDARATYRLYDLERPRWDSLAIKRLLRQCGPLGFVTAIGSLQTNIPRYFLEHQATRAELGVFGMMQNLLALGALIINAIAYAALARLARHAAAEEWGAFARTLRRLVLTGTGLALVVVLLTYLLSEPVLRLAFNDRFAGQHGVMTWMAVTSGLVWMYLFFGTALDAMRRYRLQPWIHGISTAVIAVACVWMVPRWGLYGATWAMLTGYAVECAMFVVAVALPLRSSLRGHGALA